MRALLGRLTLILGLGGAPLASATAPADYVGRWAIQSGRANLLILEVFAGDRGGALTARLLRPQTFALYPKGNGVQGIRGPYVTFAATQLMVDKDALDVVVSNPIKPSDTDELRLALIDGEHATIELVGTTVPPIAVLKVGAGDAPYGKWDPDRAYPITDSRPSNTAMTAIFEADQNARRVKPIDWTVVAPADVARRKGVMALLARGQLHTGDDYFHAAFVFQHGEAANDFLLAHTLAMVAAGKGRAGAVWIASATLDRYLQSMKQPQIYGTQFSLPPGGKATQAPFDRTLISDALREELGVGTLAEQEAMRLKMEPREAPTQADVKPR